MRLSNEGNEGNEGNTGNLGAPGGSPFYPDRVDLPFVTVEQPLGTRISDQRIKLAKFPDRAWSAQWYAYLVLDEFLSATTSWKSIAILPSFAPTGDWGSAGAQPAITDEIDALVLDAENERPDALGEITAQSDGFIGYFLDLLTAGTGYPATVKVLVSASLVAGYAAMYFKGLYQRPRPSMLCPALLPPLPMPGHASFPSGHSTQSHLMAQCMNDILTGRPQLPAMQTDLLALADRIARNRELAGLHYPSDSAAGKTLADGLHTALTALVSTTYYQSAMAAAKAEWAP